MKKTGSSFDHLKDKKKRKRKGFLVYRTALVPYRFFVW